MSGNKRKWWLVLPAAFLIILVSLALLFSILDGVR